MTATLSCASFTKIPEALGQEWVRTWNSTEGWSLPSKGQHGAEGHSFEHSCPLGATHSPPSPPPLCTPQDPLPAGSKEGCGCHPQGSTCRQAGGGGTKKSCVHCASGPRRERPTGFYDSGGTEWCGSWNPNRPLLSYTVSVPGTRPGSVGEPEEIKR